RVLATSSRGRRATTHARAGAGQGLSMAQETLILTEENVIAVLAEAKRELGTLFGNNAENTAVGITGDCEFVCLDGPSVVVRLTGRFWHEKSSVLARVASFVQARIPECVDVEIEDPSQLDDADPQGRGQGAEISLAPSVYGCCMSRIQVSTQRVHGYAANLCPRRTKILLSETREWSLFRPGWHPHLSGNSATSKDEACSEVLFRWADAEAGVDSVAVTGAWCGWVRGGRGHEAAGGGRVFAGTVSLPPGKHSFVFVVDGERRHDPNLLAERDDETEKVFNVIRVPPGSKPSLQLPDMVLPEETNSAEATDYLNSFKEYGLSTPSPPPTSSASYFGRDAAAAAAADGSGGSPRTAAPPGAPAPSAAAAAPLPPLGAGAAASANAGVAAEKGGAPTGAAPSGADALAQGLGGMGLGGNAVKEEGGGGEGQDLAAGEQAATAAAARVVMSRRRREEEETTLAAVGACLVSSSVRKDGKLIVAMVGLPGRGKSFLARSILRHLQWIGLRSRIFSVKDKRRKEVAVYEPAEYYDEGGEGEKIRRRLAAEVLGEALEALESDIDIAIYDSSNIDRERRAVLKDAVAASGLHAKVVFIESICNDEELVRTNIAAMKESSPEFEEKTEQETVRDFRSRIERYQRIYQPLDAQEGESFIKLIDAGRQASAMMTNLISGYVPGRITLLCLNLHLKPRPIWMSRHGESEFNMQGRIGGDAPLTPAGKLYATKLTEFMKRRYPPRRQRWKQQQQQQDSGEGSGPAAEESAGGSCDGDVDRDFSGEELVVWTSTMLRTGQTVAPMTLHREVMKWSQLTEINAGLMDSMTYEYVAKEMPAEYEARQKDKLRYRYPGGESYQDLFLRLEPVIFEMLRERSPLLVVGHQAILRVLYGYLTGKDPGECPTLHMPLHTAIKLTPK
ncbi:unnamed protein product, partial [Scytosiphon promiscuus]